MVLSGLMRHVPRSAEICSTASCGTHANRSSGTTRKFWGIVFSRETPPAVSPMESVSLNDDANSRKTGIVMTFGPVGGPGTAAGDAPGPPGWQALRRNIAAQVMARSGRVVGRRIAAPAPGLAEGDYSS